MQQSNNQTIFLEKYNPKNKMGISNTTTPTATLFDFLALKLAPSLAVGCITALVTIKIAHSLSAKPPKDDSLNSILSDPGAVLLGLFLGLLVGYHTFSTAPNTIAEYNAIPRPCYCSRW